MRALIYYSNTDVRLETRPVPAVGPGELLVKTEACGLCGSETLEWYMIPQAPKVLGHEPTGVVAAIGEGTEGFRIGDRVFVHHHVGCMHCHVCLRGDFTLCDSYKRRGIDPGGCVEYFRVLADNTRFDTLVLPETVSFREGTIIEPLACVMRGVKMTPIRHGDTVAVVGVGFIGMCYIQLARLAPAARIVAVDLNEWRLAKALDLGATHVLNPEKGNAREQLRDLCGGNCADAVFVTAPNRKAWDLGLSLCGRGATVNFAGPLTADETWPTKPNELYFSETKLNFNYSASHIETRAALELIAARRVDAASLITHCFGFQGAREALQLHVAGDRSLKAVFVPGDAEGVREQS